MRPGYDHDVQTHPKEEFNHFQPCDALVVAPQQFSVFDDVDQNLNPSMWFFLVACGGMATKFKGGTVLTSTTTFLSLIEQKSGITGAVTVPLSVVVLGKRWIRRFFHVS